jgi:hypothetical protein
MQALAKDNGCSQPHPIRPLGLAYDWYSGPAYAIQHTLVVRRGLGAPPIMSEAQHKDLALPARARSLS